MSAQLFYSKVARYQQLEALQSILPRGEDQLAQKRNLDSSSAALTFPFMSSELVQETGILYGVNKSNNSLVILDRFSLHNANSITFASSGAGKSYTTKVEILRQRNGVARGGAGDGQPKVETDVQMADAILHLAGVSNGHLATQGFKFLEKRTGMPLSSIEGALEQGVEKGLLEQVAPGHIRPTTRGYDFLSDLQELFIP